ncbi:hypothetical protein H4S06_004837 [Coemansia sp. BCRC 34490]|nr:hypothetical protein H4S06_004837 [Coemansia sp. BCRC 34490]
MDGHQQLASQSAELEDSPWSSYIPEEGDGENWESSTSDLGNMQQARAQHRPLLKKST